MKNYLKNLNDHQGFSLKEWLNNAFVKRSIYFLLSAILAFGTVYIARSNSNLVTVIIDNMTAFGLLAFTICYFSQESNINDEEVRQEINIKVLSKSYLAESEQNWMKENIKSKLGSKHFYEGLVRTGFWCGIYTYVGLNCHFVMSIAIIVTAAILLIVLLVQLSRIGEYLHRPSY